ncbi:MAG: hypothetical protein ACKO4T_07010 [Planctomycetaceae bacterium]
MPRLPFLEPLHARIVAAHDRQGGPTYRLLVVGHTVLAPGRDASDPWLVRVTHDGSFLPLPAPIAWPGACLEAAALLSPQDLPRVGSGLRRVLRLRRLPVSRCGFHGWSILYQLPGDVGVARVDPHDDLPHLPAFYESPLEAVDRLAFLAHRGIPSRALALLAPP